MRCGRGFRYRDSEGEPITDPDVLAGIRAQQEQEQEQAKHEHVREVAGPCPRFSHCPGNAPAVCRASYIDPRVFEPFEQGRTVRPALTRLATRSRVLRSTLYA
ncbi:hypothetical protein ACFW93_42515 [Streptomyces canus]|uniref:hypothetical protein n=1 Tax=Streptomyces canus TaxID=58343 RepID=UPI0036A3AD07